MCISACVRARAHAMFENLAQVPPRDSCSGFGPFQLSFCFGKLKLRDHK